MLAVIDPQAEWSTSTGSGAYREMRRKPLKNINNFCRNKTPCTDLIHNAEFFLILGCVDIAPLAPLTSASPKTQWRSVMDALVRRDQQQQIALVFVADAIFSWGS
jgi:hypothetical protein